MTLNSGQRALLAIIASAHHDGCVVYGRGPAETAKALVSRGLVRESGYVHVASMGKLETRPLFRVTAAGELVANGLPCSLLSGGK